MFLIEYKNQPIDNRERIDNCKEFAKKYRFLQENKLLSTVDRFCRVESNHISGLSDYGINKYLSFGEQPDSGFVIQDLSFKTGVYYYSWDGGTANIYRAFRYSTKEEAQRELKRGILKNSKKTNIVPYSIND